MRLHIKESVNSCSLIESYDYDLTKILIELLTKNEPIKLDSDYLGDDVTEDEIWNYKNDPIMVEIKADMGEFVKEIAKDIEKIEGVKDVNVVQSKSVGMSTYITVTFISPRDTQGNTKLVNDYMKYYGAEYTLKLRLSNHEVSKATDADVLVNLLNKKFDQFKKEVLDIVTKHSQQLTNYYRDYKNKKKVSSSQKQRNKERQARLQAYRQMIIDKKKKQQNSGKKESLDISDVSNTYVTDDYDIPEWAEVLDSMITKETSDYLQAVNTTTSDILASVTAIIDLDDEVIDVIVNCLNDNVIDYTCCNDFDHYQFLYDVEDQLQ